MTTRLHFHGGKDNICEDTLLDIRVQAHNFYSAETYIAKSCNFSDERGIRQSSNTWSYYKSPPYKSRYIATHPDYPSKGSFVYLPWSDSWDN